MRLVSDTTTNLINAWMPKEQASSESISKLINSRDSVLNRMRDEISDTFDNVTVQDPDPPRPPGSMMLVISNAPYIIVKVGPTLSETKLTLISVCCSLLAALSLDGGQALLALGRSTKDLATLYQSLRTSWET